MGILGGAVFFDHFAGLRQDGRGRELPARLAGGHRLRVVSGSMYRAGEVSYCADKRRCSVKRKFNFNHFSISCFEGRRGRPRRLLHALLESL